MTLGENIVLYRKRRGLSQKDLAGMLGVSATCLSYWENDRREPDILMLNTLCGILGVEPNTLLGFTDVDKNTPPIPSGPGNDGIDGEIFLEELVSLLRDSGLMREGGDISDEDFRFLTTIVAALSAWFQDD